VGQHAAVRPGRVTKHCHDSTRFEYEAEQRWAPVSVRRSDLTDQRLAPKHPPRQGQDCFGRRIRARSVGTGVIPKGREDPPQHEIDAAAGDDLCGTTEAGRICLLAALGVGSARLS
jgi:hypothetical protein